MAGCKEIQLPEVLPLGLGAGDDEITECNGRQIRPQDAQFLEFLVGAPLHQQRNEIAHPAAAEPRIGVLHHRGDVIVRKSRVFLGEAPLDVANQYPLFLRHPDIVALILTSGQDAWCKRFVVEIVGEKHFCRGGVASKVPQRAAHRTRGFGDLSSAEKAGSPANRPRTRPAAPVTATTAAAAEMPWRPPLRRRILRLRPA
jgi:hypothetical protein